MPRLRKPTPIPPKINPKDGIPLNRPKRDARASILPTLNQPTPLRIRWPAQTREVRAATFTLVGEIHHKRAHPVPAPAPAACCPCPVIVVPVVPCCVVSLRVHPLDVQVWFPPLKSARAVFDAAHCGVPREEGVVAESVGWVDFGCFAVCYYRGSVFSHARNR